MTLLSWNIQHGGGARIAPIIDAIIGHDPDIIGLSEFRMKPGGALCAALAAKLLSEKRFDEHLDPLPFSGCKQQPSKD